MENECCETKTSLTEQDINDLIVEEFNGTLGMKTTAVTLVLKNGFEVTGLSSCVDPKTYNQEIGNKIARQRAVDQVWMVAGYALQEKLAYAKSQKEKSLHLQKLSMGTE